MIIDIVMLKTSSLQKKKKKNNDCGREFGVIVAD